MVDIAARDLAIGVQHLRQLTYNLFPRKLTCLDEVVALGASGGRATIRLNSFLDHSNEGVRQVLNVDVYRTREVRGQITASSEVCILEICDLRSHRLLPSPTVKARLCCIIASIRNGI
jgi:hypothetical protein